MRILHLAGRLSERGGADLCLLGVLELQNGRHELRLAVGDDDGTARAPCAILRVEGLDSRVRHPVPLDPLLEGFRPDVLHLHNVVNPAVLEWAADRGAVMTVQDHRFFCPGRGKWTADGRACRDAMSPEVCAGCFSDPTYFGEIHALTAERLAALRRLRLVVLSDYMKRELVAAGAPRERITVIPPFVHGLDLAAPPADGPPCVLFAGRLVEAKGVREAIEAWRRARVGLPLVLAGTGPLRAEVEAEEGCQVQGWVPHARLAPLYRRAAALLMPSRWQEPFGLAGLEALTFGVPVVAWDSGGVREWHPGGPLLVGWGDVDGLAAGLRVAVGRRADAPPGFDPEALMARLCEVYRGEAG